MGATLPRRMICSVKAVISVWFVSGLVFACLVKSPGALIAWLIWGTPFFLAGWLLIGLPLVLMGEKAIRTSAALVIVAAGVGGSAVMELPALVVWALSPGIRYAWRASDLWWPGAAFLIAAAAAGLYLYLVRAGAHGSASSPAGLDGPGR